MSTFPFSKRTDWPFDSNPLIQRLESLRKKKAEVIDLTESNPTRCGLKYPSEKILKALAVEQNLRYEPSSHGQLNARQAVVDYYARKGYRVHPDHIVLTSSTSEAYSFLFRLLLNVDDHILVGQPSYPLFQCLTDLHDVVTDFYPLVYENQWRMDLCALEKCVGSKVKSILLVNPNNPTGSYISPAELKLINRLCKQHKFAIICDEVFSDFRFEEAKGAEVVESLVNNDEVLTFSLGGISKSLGLPQMKVGWIVVSGPADQVKDALRRLEIIADTYLSVSAPAQNALPLWFQLQNEIQSLIKERTNGNWTYLKNAVKEFSDCEILKAQGGWYGIIKLPSFHDEHEWVMSFLERDLVFVHPGYFFDFKEEPYIVVSLLPETKKFKEGLERIFKRTVEKK